MCGIFLYHSKIRISNLKKKQLWIQFAQTQHRGPEESIFKQINTDTVIGFHRLCINDVSNGSQPFTNKDNTIFLICNGEIYNYKALIKKYNLNCTSESDCEVILRMYEVFATGSLEKLISELDGVFAFVIVDTRMSDPNIIFARDTLGVRSMYFAQNENELYITSEVKSIPREMQTHCKPFVPGTYSIINQWQVKSFKNTLVYQPDPVHHKFENRYFSKPEQSIIQKNISALLENAVEKRLLSDRPIGCLLSGGLDSSLIAALVQQKTKTRIHTFSIGMKGSPDLKYARMVANHIDSVHHEVIVSAQKMLESIPNVVKSIESYDETTVLASTPMWLLCKYISENSSIKVLFTGEGSDEASGSYLYFHNSPTFSDFQNECLRLLRDLHRFDVLRCEKCISAWGLEARVPFLDQDFLKEYMSIHPTLKSPKDNIKNYKPIEKFLLRNAFDDGLLPQDVLWRTKEAFSNGVSPLNNDWHSIVNNDCKDFESTTFGHEYVNEIEKKPLTNKGAYFRFLFDQCYNNANLIPYYWTPKWTTTTDSSARALDIYDDVQNKNE